LPSRKQRRRPSGGRQARWRTTREAFRVLRSNLLVTISDLDNPVVVVTSAFEREGKTSTAVNLAESLATAGPRVVLVDLDLRSPQSHRLLGVDNDAGVSDVLLDRRPLDECLQYIQVPVADSSRVAGMYFLSAGPHVGNPTELLATPRTGRMLEVLSKQADIVLLDTPPVLPVADTLVIGRLAAGAVLVVEAQHTPAPAARRAKDALTRNQTRLLGVVLNQFQAKYANEVADGYGYGHGIDAAFSPYVGGNGKGGNGTGA
jgi:capsular exopolysaccharide synthesis family protein